MAQETVVFVDFAARKRIDPNRNLSMEDSYVREVNSVVVAELSEETDCSATADAASYGMFSKLFSRHVSQD